MASLFDEDEESKEDAQDVSDHEVIEGESEEEEDEDEGLLKRSVKRTTLSTKEQQLQPPNKDRSVQTKALSGSQQSIANTNAVMASNGHVTVATLEAEVQCIICRYALFKPVSVLCGHSFCRVCLLDSLLTRSLKEAQCPICRVDILLPFSAKATLASMFSINVTLWNIVQLLVPSVEERKLTYQQEEDQKFAHKLDQLDVKRKMLTLGERAASYHNDEGHETSIGRWEEDREGHEGYPVLKVEDTDDGGLHVSRNIVLDTSDENEDGYASMRVGIAIVEFPSIFESFNEHQECSVNVIKMEEDEEIADGMPFFMSDNGDDDGLVCSSYYNEISLYVCDEAGNCVMERTRGAHGGAVTFPALRLDVPGGMYTFRFSDNLYGLKLSITTRLREPHEVSDTPVADYVSLIHDEARDASRRNRHTRRDSDSEREFSEEASESDDSFIVNDLNEDEQPSDSSASGEEKNCWEYNSDDEEADEARARRRARQRQRSARRLERDAQHGRECRDEEELCGDQSEKEDLGVDAPEHEEESDGEERTEGQSVRVVEDGVFSVDEDADQKKDDDLDAAEESNNDEEQRDAHEAARPRRRNANQILDSDDEDENKYPLFREQSSDEGGGPLFDDDEASTGALSGCDEDSDYGHGSKHLSIAVEDDHSEEDDTTDALKCRRKVQRFQDEESDETAQQSELNAVSHSDLNEDRRPRKRARKAQLVNEVESDKDPKRMDRSICETGKKTLDIQDDIDEDEEASVDLQSQQSDQIEDEMEEEGRESDNTLQAEDYGEEENSEDEVEDYGEEEDEGEDDEDDDDAMGNDDETD